MILAVLFSPFLAIYAQKRIDIQREGRGAKLAIFKDLMGTRSFTLSPIHVQALNRIDLEFTGDSPSERDVRKIWREYLDHLSSLPAEPTARQQKLSSWLEKNQDYLAELLVAMGECVGYSFDKVYMKKGIYSPEGHAAEYFDNWAIRTSLRELLQNQRSLYTMLVPQNPDVAKEFETNLSNVLKGSQALKVVFKADDGS
jgi:hypothetical protein